MKEEFIQRWFTHVPSTPHKENDKRLMIEDLEKLLEAQRKACLEAIINKQEWIAIENAIQKARIK